VLELQPEATEASQKPDAEKPVVIGCCRFVSLPSRSILLLKANVRLGNADDFWDLRAIRKING
jgi:hypothetical protein